MFENETFKIVDEFPNYAVSDYGRVFNIKFDRELTYSPTEYGELTVGLMKGGKQYRRSVKVLVARAWVHGETMVCNTPIQKDGDRDNLHPSNLAWRPRWFAWAYLQQFRSIPAWANQGPVREIHTGLVYDSILSAALATGTFYDDIRKSITYGHKVYPDSSIYTFVK